MAALNHEQLKVPAGLSVVITNDKKIQELNNAYLGINQPTDVLSFPSDNEIDPDSGEKYLGDILISFPRAEQQAKQLEHSTLDEIRLLIVHGVLHLLGYDHGNEIEKNNMWLVQTEILKSFNVYLDRLPE